jgi:hypothetical protein
MWALTTQSVLKTAPWNPELLVSYALAVFIFLCPAAQRTLLPSSLFPTLFGATPFRAPSSPPGFHLPTLASGRSRSWPHTCLVRYDLQEHELAEEVSVVVPVARRPVASGDGVAPAAAVASGAGLVSRNMSMAFAGDRPSGGLDPRLSSGNKATAWGYTRSAAQVSVPMPLLSSPQPGGQVRAAGRQWGTSSAGSLRAGVSDARPALRRWPACVRAAGRGLEAQARAAARLQRAAHRSPLQGACGTGSLMQRLQRTQKRV